MNLKYVGALRDFSGYGEAGRHDVGALLKAGVNITTEIPTYCLEVSNFGDLGDECLNREKLELDYKIKILHVTPNVYPKYFEDGIYHIGRVIWETDKLPAEFAKYAQMCDEIWTASEFNKQSIINAGVTKPIYVIPEAIEDQPVKREPFIAVNNEDFKFYSIFEWTERKNPTALLMAYWREFENIKHVSLTIKTYIDSFRPEKKKEINKYVTDIKTRLGLENYAPVYLFKDLMTRDQIYRFHSTFDCFVSTHRGEGWGIPQCEAMMMEKPIISSNWGGVHEYLTDGQDALLLNTKSVQVRNNNRNQQWYTPDQNWADVNVDEVREKMRWVYDNRDKASKIGKEGRKTVIKKFSFETVGKMMLERLNQIEI